MIRSWDRKRDVTGMFPEARLHWNRGTGVVHIPGQGSGVGKGRRRNVPHKFDLVSILLLYLIDDRVIN